jgi:CRISPR-associated protein Csb2
MSRALLISVRLHEGRYHGVGDVPPSPARLFQALVAGAGLSGPLVPPDTAALEWLEALSGRRAPIIGSPRLTNGQSLKNYMPNNDLDAVGGDPRRMSAIRTTKHIRPRLFDAEIPFLYAWEFDDEEESNRQAQTVCSLAERLYQFGRGVDLAWAWGELLDGNAIEDRLANYPGIIYRPSHRGNGTTLACPQPGSLESLKNRYAAASQRFRTQVQSRSGKQLFSQPPKPFFAQVAYDSPPFRRVYELRESSADSSLAVYPLAGASMLVVALRDGAVERLRRALPDQSSDIERILVGRKANGADNGPSSSRVRIVPLPSIGHHHADRGIRRVLVEVPAESGLRADDVHWAFSGLEIVSPEIAAARSLILTPSSDESMCAHYGIGDRAFRVWRTVTPAALPASASRRRIDPERLLLEAKRGAERAAEQSRAAFAVIQALRFAEIRSRAEWIRVQREPFEANGERVEAFAPGTRFAKERLWHVEITFAEPINGCLIIGDGRFLGLGVMAPVQGARGSQ